LAAPLARVYDMHVTIAICTWNRANLLRRTLEGVIRLAIPLGLDWEVLVVNNNSTDATDAVIKEAASRLPIRGYFERRPGKSHALNLAVREAQGEYILWTDDDVLVDEGWLTEYVAAFQRWPDASFFGGPIEPWLESPTPGWLTRVFSRVSNIYGALDLGPEPVPLTARVPYGANMAVRTADQRRFPYDPAICRRPNSLVRGEETFMLRRMLEAGLRGRWVPSARVRHWVPRQNQSAAYVRGWHVGAGQVLAAQPTPSNWVWLFGRPRWLWREAVQEEVRYWLGRAVSRPETWIEHLIRASRAWGRLSGPPRD
jgi:glucosyl-dolichyl phosphate glucuronosyltransferase